MPTIKITFTIDMEVERYISYNEHDDPRKIYEAIFEESDEDEYRDFLYEIVEKDLKDVPHVANIDTSIASHRDFEVDVTDVPNEPIPCWKSFVSEERLEEIATEAKREELYEALESATYNSDYDRIIELATQLKALTKED